MFFVTHSIGVVSFWLRLPIGDLNAAWGEPAARETKMVESQILGLQIPRVSAAGRRNLSGVDPLGSGISAGVAVLGFLLGVEETLVEFHAEG